MGDALPTVDDLIRQLGERECTTADTRDGVFDLAADERGQPLRASAHCLHRLMEHAEHRNTVPRLGLEPQRERPLERRERQLVGPQRALQRMAPQLLDEVGAADDDSRLRAAEKLVP